ncbi:glycosyltransferase [Nonomuraea sp. FMUSA5-5]|uniref:Glycosyltransferase n=1 Tax=Nonomuraea composti TaxID=2720023 RepID=A0ABX1AT99_9ACTN|nr:glycosyltransferase [Nonomuraea sp. FMUSA5-5]NJP88838.1 glycosyltransferase [Nonomuraea sp. FMUSA5-5]
MKVEATPFLRVSDPAGRPLPWVLVRAPVTGRARHARLAALARDGHRFAGMTSYAGFPGPGWRDERDYGLLCEAWFHCFRRPDRHLPPHGPRALISESDFTDPRRVDPARIAAAPRADVVCVCAAHLADLKNWPLVRRCLPRLRAAGLRVLVVDPPERAAPPGTEFTPRLPWPHLLAAVAGARCLLVPGVLDASPRVLAEALCLDVPVVVNRSILGGWKYVNAFTGVFFDGADDVVQAVTAACSGTRRPRAYFTAHHGPLRAGAAVLAVLRRLQPDLPAVSHVLLTPDDGGARPERR